MPLAYGFISTFREFSKRGSSDTITSFLRHDHDHEHVTSPYPILYPLKQTHASLIHEHDFYEHVLTPDTITVVVLSRSISPCVNSAPQLESR
jgi:hypothetical protein